MTYETFLVEKRGPVDWVTLNRPGSLAVGLVSEVVPDDKLEAAAQPYIDDMLYASPIGLRLTKDGLNHAIDASSLEAAMAIENRNQLMCAQSPDFAEGQRAFLEKRRPVYTGTWNEPLL